MLSNASDQAIKKKTAEFESILNREKIIHEKTIKEKEESIQELIKERKLKEIELKIQELRLNKIEKVNDKLLVQKEIEKMSSIIDKYNILKSSYSRKIIYSKHFPAVIIGLSTFLISFKFIDGYISAVASIAIAFLGYTEYSFKLINLITDFFFLKFNERNIRSLIDKKTFEEITITKNIDTDYDNLINAFNNEKKKFKELEFFISKIDEDIKEKENELIGY